MAGRFVMMLSHKVSSTPLVLDEVPSVLRNDLESHIAKYEIHAIVALHPAALETF